MNGECPRHPGQRYIRVLGGCTVCVQERKLQPVPPVGQPPAPATPTPATPPVTSRTVLAAIEKLIPSCRDVDGHAAATLTLVELATAASTSRKRMRSYLWFFQNWRVLWLRRMPEAFEIRFERKVVEDLLAAKSSMMTKMFAHRREREAVSPRRKRRQQTKDAA